MARVARIVGGSFLILIGIALLVLPGPGIVTIAAGVLLLARDFVWADRLVTWARSKIPSRGTTERSSVDEH